MALDTLAQYYSTATLAQGGKFLWPAATNTNLAPTLLTLGEAFITLILCSIILISYAHGAKSADKWDGRRETFEKIVSGITFVLASGAAGAMFHTGNMTGSDSPSLMSFACNATSAQQSFWHQFFDYGVFCLQQARFNLGDMADYYRRWRHICQSRMWLQKFSMGLCLFWCF